MAEHEPQSAPIHEDAIAEVLGTRSATVRDVAYGEGHQFSLGRGDARLEVFPRTGVTRLTASDVRVELFGSTIAEVSPGGVEFSRSQPGQDASLTVVPGGGIVFTLIAGGERGPAGTSDSSEPPPPPPTTPPVRAADTAQHAGTDASPPVRAADTAQHAGTADASPAPPAPVVDPPAAPQTAREDPSRPAPDRTSGQAAAETEQERISLTGRLGRDPQFRTTKTGSLVGKFPLAVHREDGHTTWHTVLAFGSRAEQLQRRLASGELTQGREVDVVGYLHVNTRPGKDGTPRKVQKIYAVAVKKR